MGEIEYAFWGIQYKSCEGNDRWTVARTPIDWEEYDVRDRIPMGGCGDDVAEIKDPNLSKEIKDSLGNDVKSVMLIDVKKENNSTPHTFVIPKQKEKTKVNTTGVINLPTLYIGDKNTIEANIGGLRTALNSMAKGNDFDIDKFSAKVTVKHKF